MDSVSGSRTAGAQPSFEVGDFVKIEGLQRKPEYNNDIGTVCSVPDANGRVVVRFNHHGDLRRGSFQGVNLRKLQSSGDNSSFGESTVITLNEGERFRVRKVSQQFTFNPPPCYKPSPQELLIGVAETLREGDSDDEVAQAVGKAKATVERLEQSGSKGDLDALYRRGAARLADHPDMGSKLLVAVDALTNGQAERLGWFGGWTFNER